jgi:hypothetical protein
MHIAQMEARFGQSPVHVKTPRGQHLYYLAGDVMPNLRSEGLPVDINHPAPEPKPAARTISPPPLT